MARDTHEVLNQPPPLTGYNVFRSDRALVETLAREAASSAFADLTPLGERAGSAQAQEWGRLANEHPPKLRTHDRFGHRVDDVEFHPAYHELMRVAVVNGLHAAPWTSTDPVAHTARAAKFYVWGQVEAGHGCPISMTYAAIPALRSTAHIAQLWEPRLAACEYDPVLRPIDEKSSAICGMAMTEKQGGSDVRANLTRAAFAERTDLGDAYLLTGHKWFCSAPMSDMFLVLAQTDAGLSCFLMPRLLPDGMRNRIFIQRLKDKLGNRSNASSEIELDGAWALLLGEAGRGVQTIVEMVNGTRLDCINGSASLMRAALSQAIHHAMYRHTFGKALVDHALMQNVLADLAVESEAAMALLLRLARATDRASGDAREAAIKRLGTAVGKYYVCKRTPVVVGEALECLGGNGYVEESPMPRLYREAPLNSMWEGSGNINALDVLRILVKQPEVLDAFRSEIEPSLDDARMQHAWNSLTAALRDEEAAESRARSVVERMALLWQAALLSRDPYNPAAEVFIDSRIGGRWDRTLGTLEPSQAHKLVVERAQPAQSVEYSER
ncbi:MAG TPA: acyl-CoA dehydrogenase family protein [Candidatus Baltobacteraceae bacterium]|nr:acyl-CoA dehydrogenase family protein [Candidatus Baltobacteraceae bacterium]